MYTQHSAGIVTLSQYTCMPDGESYLYVWCDDWTVVTDKQVLVDGFRSSEKWQLVGLVNEKAVLVIPGCQVKGWAACNTPPRRTAVFVLDSEVQQLEDSFADAVAKSLVAELDARNLQHLAR